MQPVSIISPSFDARNSGRCRLSLLCCENGIAASILDAEKNKIVALKYFLYAGKADSYNDLNKYAGKIISREFLLRLRYNAVRCIYPTQCFTLMPKGLAVPQQYKAQLEQHHTLGDLDELHCCEVREIEAECLFAAPGPLSAKLFETMGNVTYVHQCAPLIGAAMRYETQDGKALLLVCAASGFVNLTLRTGGQMKFYNTYPVGSPQDLLYFVMHVINRFDLDAGHIEILTAGELKSAYRAELNRFFENITQVKFGGQCFEELQGEILPQFDLLILMEQCA